MLCNHYDRQTGQYLSSTLADSDPKDDSRWLEPAFSTVTPIPNRKPLTWPFWKDGAWVLMPDYRGRVLYRTDTGERTEILAAGVTPADAGLTETPRPSDEYRWTDGAWAIDPDIVARKVKERAMAEFQQRLANAQTKNYGRADAHAAGVLSDVEEAQFVAWSKYQMDLSRVVNAPDFPASAVWPDEPDDEAIRRDVDAKRAAAAEAAKAEAEQAEQAAQAEQADEAGPVDDKADTDPAPKVDSSKK
ncbi:tail fiber assembly protein [Burkholderia gladioli]|uniref:tail fiber assembly protein n=1 Tax=Burkholderia gladioli TaxID=28095 RepID=UPI001C6025D4|nr:tail fiber assembly protein [Burkholderia gladioli]MBW5283387.1 tail fiber assembly protein [Burkholderia gladioli]